MGAGPHLHHCHCAGVGPELASARRCVVSAEDVLAGAACGRKGHRWVQGLCPAEGSQHHRPTWACSGPGSPGAWPHWQARVSGAWCPASRLVPAEGGVGCSEGPGEKTGTRGPQPGPLLRRVGFRPSPRPSKPLPLSWPLPCLPRAKVSSPLLQLSTKQGQELGCWGIGLRVLEARQPWGCQCPPVPTHTPWIWPRSRLRVPTKLWLNWTDVLSQPGRETHGATGI